MANNEASLLIKIKQAGAEVLDRLVITLGDVVDGVKKVAEFMYSFVEAYAESEAATNKLSQAMINQGVYTTELRKKYEEQAAALQRVTTYQDDQIVNSQAILQSFVGQREVSEELTLATLNLAAAKKMDLATASELVGKSIQNGTELLKRQGIQIEDSSDKATRMANIIRGLNGEFGGQAAAAARGLGGIQQLKNAYNDFQETIGKRLAPVIIMVIDKFKEFFENLNKGTSSVDMLMAGIQAIGQVFIGLFGIVELVGKLIGTNVAAWANIIGNLIEGNFKQALNSAKLYVTEWGNQWVTSYQETQERIKSLNDAFLAGVGENLKEEEKKEKESLDNRLIARQEYNIKAAELEAATAIAEQEAKIARWEAEKAAEDGRHSEAFAKKIQILDKEIQLQTNHQAKMDLIKKRGALVDQMLQAKTNEQIVKDREQTMNRLVELQHSKSKEIAAIGKAAALYQIGMDTYTGAVSAYKAMAGIPYVGPILGAAAAAALIAYGAEKSAKVAGMGLAEGGIVKATPGGVPAIIGEGGRDEAVIPLDDPSTQQRLGLGGGTTINFNGPIMGDASQAAEFARALDRELLKLRQSNQSVAFETDIF